MTRESQALEDEPTAGPIPTREELGRQVRRLLIAEELANDIATPEVDDGTLADRAIGLVSLAIPLIFNDPDTLFALNPALLRVINQLIEAACGPNGLVTKKINEAIQAAYGQGGTFAQMIQDEINEAITAACQPGGSIHQAAENRFRIREENRYATGGQHLILPIPDLLGAFPPAFPCTIDEFASMTGVDLERLLMFYGLDAHGDVPERMSRLAAYLNITLN